MNNKALLLAITILVTVLGLVTLGSIALSSLNITLSQALRQESVISNSNNTAAIGAVGSPLYNLTIGDKSYPIKFNITGGILDTMAIDGDQAILLVNINASTNGGILEIELPRELIDSKTKSNTDEPYSVYEDDVDRRISFIESKSTNQLHLTMKTM